MACSSSSTGPLAGAAWGAADLRGATPADVSAVAALEAASYAPDEAATPERLAYRVAHAPHLFAVLLLE
jgi:hypothetical protein